MGIFYGGIFIIDRQTVSILIHLLGSIKIQGRADTNLLDPSRQCLVVFQGVQFIQDFQKTGVHAFMGFILIDRIPAADPDHNRETILEEHTLTFPVIFQASLYDQF